MNSLRSLIKAFRNPAPEVQEIPTVSAPPLPEPTIVHETTANDAPKSTYTTDLTTVYNEDAYEIRTNCSSEPCSRLFKQHMNKILSSGENHDVVLTFGEKTIPAHRKILAARSEYFKTMFEGKMAESQQQTINIEEEQEYEPMRALLQYFYCEYIELAKYNMLELLHVASKYAPENKRLLQTLVHNIYTTLLQESTIEQVYTYAKENEISTLVTACEKYIYLNLTPEVDYQNISSQGTYDNLDERWNHNIYLVGNCTEKSAIFNYLKTRMIDIEPNDSNASFKFIREVPDEQIVYYTVSNSDYTGELERPKRRRVNVPEDDFEKPRKEKKSSFRGVNVVCFNYNDEQSFIEATDHLESASDQVTLLLLGIHSITIPQNMLEQAQQLAMNYGCEFLNVDVGDSVVMDRLHDRVMKVSKKVEEHIQIQRKEQMVERSMKTKK